MNTRHVPTLSLRATDSRDGRVLDRTFDRFPIRIGRNELNDLRLDFKFVSGFHAVIERTGEGALVLRDLGSRNGCFVGGARMQAHQRVDLARAGQTFEIGPLRFQCAMGTAPKATGDEQTAVMLAISEDPNLQNATEAWQAIVAEPQQQRGQDARDVALRGLKRLASLYVPDAGSLDDPENVVRFLSKTKQSLDLLFGAFVPLRDGARQIQLQTDAAARGESDAWAAVASVRTASELAAKALDWRDPSSDTLRTIQNAFADFIIAQVAIVNGLLEGLERVLEEFSRESVQARFAQKGSSMRFGPFLDSSLLKLSVERQKELLENVGGMLARYLGEEFAAAFLEMRRSKKKN